MGLKVHCFWVIGSQRVKMKPRHPVVMYIFLWKNATKISFIMQLLLIANTSISNLKLVFGSSLGETQSQKSLANFVSSVKNYLLTIKYQCQKLDH